MRTLWQVGLLLAALAGGMSRAQEPLASASVGQIPAEDAGPATRSARLSFLIEGEVSISRTNGDAPSAAQRNMALAQGDRVSTVERGQAEIEFEDGSVARLTPNSTVGLDFLGADAGGPVSILRVVRGLVYLELRASSADRFRVAAGGDTFWPVENSTVRVNLDDPPAVLAVLDGRIRVEHLVADGGGNEAQSIQGYRTYVRAGESVRDDGTDGSRYFLSEGITPETWDHWNEQRDQAAADAVASGTGVRDTFAGSQGYGWGDLDASGDWYAGDGQAPVWQPYEALDAGFDPYSYGSWTYFPGGGYTWASGYGWGWTPYRCGNWQYWDGFGWGWQPNAFCGGNWRFGGGANVVRGPRGYRPPGVPIQRPVGVHPIWPGLHGGERPPAVAALHQDRDRTIGGVILRPIRPAGFGMTPRGGSAAGSALRRDYAVDSKTHTAVLGAHPAVDAPRLPIGTPQSWRAVNTRPDPPAQSGGLRGLFGHRNPSETPVRIDPSGNPYTQPMHRDGALQSRAIPQAGEPPARIQPGAMQNGYRPQTPPPQMHVQPPSAPRIERSVPAPAPHSAPPPPANSAAPSKK